MKKLVFLICSFVLVFSCVTVSHAWPMCLTPEALGQMGYSHLFLGKSIAVLVCDPFDAYINGNECHEVSYDSLVSLRDDLVMSSFDVRLMKGFQSDYYYLAFYDRTSGLFKGCIGDGGLGSQCVYRAKDPTLSNHTIQEIAGTGIYWIDSTAVSSLEYHYVDSTKFDNISRTIHMNVRSQYIAIVKESVLLDGTPCYILKYLYNGKWVGIVCDKDGPIYCTATGSSSIPPDSSTGGSGSGASFDATDVINAINSVFDAVSSVDDSISFVSTYLTRLNNNFLNFANDFKIAFEMQGNDLSNIYSLLLAMYQSFYDRFSDLDLTYYNDAEITLYNGDYLDWSESDRGAINVEATDIGTLELIGFPNVSGYAVDHSFGGDIIVRRNDGTYFPDTWVLDGGTVTMPVITDGYASITVTAPEGAVIRLAGNTHTMTADAYSVNVEFGSYPIDVSYTDGDEVKTSSYTVDVDGYNNYAVDFAYTPGGFVVTVDSNTGYQALYHYICIDGVEYNAKYFFSDPVVFQLSVGSVISFRHDSGYTTKIYVDGTLISGKSYLVDSDCSIFYKQVNGAASWNITTSDTSSVVGDFNTPTVTVSANPATTTPLTIQSLVLPSGSSFWYAIDTDGNQYSFDPVSNLALNRSFVVHTYTAEEVENLDNFPSGYWLVNWSGSSKYITVKFEEYSKFFLWLNRFLINFRDTLYTKMEDITVTANGDVIVSSTDYTEQLNTIIGKLDGVVTDIDSVTNVNISLDNDAYNVFYVTGEDGETQSVTDFAGDLTTASGRLLSLLYRLVFSDALSTVDDDLTGFEDFFTSQDQTETAAYAYGQNTSSEDVDVWSAS